MTTATPIHPSLRPGIDDLCDWRTVRAGNVACKVIDIAARTPNGSPLLYVIQVTATGNPVYRRGELLDVSANFLTLRKRGASTILPTKPITS